VNHELQKWLDEIVYFRGLVEEDRAKNSDLGVRQSHSREGGVIPLDVCYCRVITNRESNL